MEPLKEVLLFIFDLLLFTEFSSTFLEIPKSEILTIPLLSTNIFAPFISLFKFKKKIFFINNI